MIKSLECVEEFGVSGGRVLRKLVGVLLRGGAEWNMFLGVKRKGMGGLDGSSLAQVTSRCAKRMYLTIPYLTST